MPVVGAEREQRRVKGQVLPSKERRITAGCPMAHVTPTPNTPHASMPIDSLPRRVPRPRFVPHPCAVPRSFLCLSRRQMDVQ
eukprot:3969217-Pleurochrysis_carterae.AAC.2